MDYSGGLSVSTRVSEGGRGSEPERWQLRGFSLMLLALKMEEGAANQGMQAASL